MKLLQTGKYIFIIWLYFIIFACTFRIITQHTLIDALAGYLATAGDIAKTEKEIEPDLLLGYNIKQVTQNAPAPCPTCASDLSEPIYLVACNTGKMYSLIIQPYLNQGQAAINFAYDEISQTRLNFFQDYNEITVSIYQERNIVSVHRMKNVFCNDCHKKILSVIDEQNITSFVLFLPQKQAFYPINDGLEIYTENYSITLNIKKLYQDV